MDKRIIILQMLHLIRTRKEFFLCHAINHISKFNKKLKYFIGWGCDPITLVELFPEIEKIAFQNNAEIYDNSGKVDVQGAWWDLYKEQRILTLSELLNYYPPTETKYTQEDIDKIPDEIFEYIKHRNPDYDLEQIIVTAQLMQNDK